MKKVSQYIDLYTSVFKGEKVVINDFLIFSDGSSWIVDGRVIDSIKNKRNEFNKILYKCSVASNLLLFLGIDETNMYDEYSLISSPDGMMLLVKFDDDSITFVYMISFYVAVEQIDITDRTLKYDCFWLDDNELKHGFLHGNLSSKSIQILLKKLKQEKISVTQNFFYDMYLEGMKDYLELAEKAMQEHQVNDESMHDKLDSVIQLLKRRLNF